MDATKPQAQRQSAAGQEDASQLNGLDRRYGKIGISAVAAAVRCKGEERRTGAQKSASPSAPFAESFESD
jgi:hypothetical protein